MTAMHNKMYEWAFTAKTTLADVEKVLRRHRLRIHAMTFNGSEFSIKLQGHSRFYYGNGESMGSAFSSALEDFGMDMIQTYARTN